MLDLTIDPAVLERKRYPKSVIVGRVDVVQYTKHALSRYVKLGAKSCPLE